MRLLLLLLSLLLPFALCADPTAPPPPNPDRPPRPDDGFVNPIKDPIRTGLKKVFIRKFSQIPPFFSQNTRRSRASRLTGMTYHNKDLYVTTSTAGALIYRIMPSGNNYMWANIQKVVLRDTGRNVNCETAQHGGLRGLAFPPDHDETGLFYVSYMEDKPENEEDFEYFSVPPKPAKIVADSVVVELRYNWTENRVVPGSYRTVIRIGMSTKDHPIKQIAFDGADLLIGHGDGALGSNPSPGGMNNDGLGKILKVNPKKSGNRPYTIPADNPFIGDSRYNDGIYAVGFRNPHNICVSKKHGIFVADVGRDNIEEVNIVTAGGNYGWGEREGTFVNLPRGGTLTGIAPLPADDAKFGYTYPAVQVGHFQPEGGQIRWGIAIAGSCPVEQNSPLVNTYLYCNFGERGELYYSWVGAMKRAVTKGKPSDLTQAKVYRARQIYLDADGDGEFEVMVDNLVSLVSEDLGRNVTRVDARFGRGPNNELYLMSKVTGAVYRIMSTVKDWKEPF